MIVLNHVLFSDGIHRRHFSRENDQWNLVSPIIKKVTRTLLALGGMLSERQQ